MSKPKGHVPIIVVHPDVRETVRSYLIRACMENGWPSQTRFLSRMHLARSQLLSGWQPDVVAACFGLSLEAFSQLAGKWGRQHVTLAGETIDVGKTSKFSRRVCLHCLAEDPVAFFEWELGFISDCTRHGPLTSLCECGRPFAWTDRHLCRCDKCAAVSDLEAPRLAPSPRVLPFQEYLLGRLGRLDRTESPVLDDLPVDAVVDVSRAFGRLQEHGEKAVLADEATLVRWGEAGFAWLNRDDKPDDLVDAISRHRNASGEMAPLVPIRALGSIAELSALHYRGADRLTALIARRLGKALGYPVFDIWRTDYRDLASCLASTGLEKRLCENP